jgi:hypothetical protein
MSKRALITGITGQVSSLLSGLGWKPRIPPARGVLDTFRFHRIYDEPVETGLIRIVTGKIAFVLLWSSLIIVSLLLKTARLQGNIQQSESGRAGVHKPYRARVAS